MMTTVSLTGPIALPAEGRDPTALVILLHGYGSNGQDLMGLTPYWRDSLRDAAVLAPNAPQPCPGQPGGYQWWPLSNFGPEALAAGARTAATVLNGYIDAQLAHYGLKDDRLVLIGFSQGTMLALQVGLRRETPPAGVIGYSGLLVDEKTLPDDLRSGPPVLLVHGNADPVVPVIALSHAEAVLRSHGLGVETHISAGVGHSVDEAGLRLGEQFLRRVLRLGS